MSNFRNKAREIKAAGVAERGNFEPSGTPLRLYNYWLRRSLTDHADDIRMGYRRENFCHFWRVVAIWAPLMFLKQKAFKALDHRLAFPVLIGIAIAFMVFTAVVSGSFLTLLAVAGITLGVFVGLAAIGVGVVFLVKRYWNSDWNDTAAKVAVVTAFALAVGWLLFILILAVMQEGWIVLVMVGGILAFIAATVFGVIMLTEFIAGRRAVRNAERDKVINEWIRTGEGSPPWYKEPRAPGKISKFFTGVGDFLILIAQIVRVKKWKICPMVDVSTE